MFARQVFPAGQQCHEFKIGGGLFTSDLQKTFSHHALSQRTDFVEDLAASWILSSLNVSKWLRHRLDWISLICISKFLTGKR
jgi:hypothetical protein